jgi:hypothetical protein
MLRTHFDRTEEKILAQSRIPASAGHTLHRGTPRELFIRQFLEGHLGKRASIGTGEIIDAQSEPRQSRNQYDIVIYKSEFPRIDFEGGINAFLAESVIATLEVKSLLTESELEAAISAASNAKRLARNVVRPFYTGYIPPGILSFVVAYDGPAKIGTVFSWLRKIEREKGLNSAPLPPRGVDRAAVLSESLEGIFCLGLGTILFDNMPGSIIDDQERAKHPENKWTVLSHDRGSLLWLFLRLTQAVSGVSAEWPEFGPYLAHTQWHGTFEE